MHHRRSALRGLFTNQSLWIPNLSSKEASFTALTSHTRHATLSSGRAYADFSDIFKQLAEKEKNKAEGAKIAGIEEDEEAIEEDESVKAMRSKGKYDSKLTEVFAKLRGESRMGATVDHDDYRKRFERAMFYKTKRDTERYNKAERELEEGKRKAAEEWELYKAQQQKENNSKDPND